MVLALYKFAICI